MEEEVLILEKITYLKSLLKKLKVRLEKYEVEENLEEKETLFAAMSKFSEEIVEIAIKINNKFLELNSDFAASYYETFSKLKNFYDIDEEILKKLAKTTGLRNRIAHEYEYIDEQITIRSFQNILELYDSYIKIVKDMVNSEKEKKS